MGHDTAHPANSAYPALDCAIKYGGRNDIFIGSVEGYSELAKVVRRVDEFGTKKVHLQPLMIVAGDHVLDDMASDAPDSWKSVFTKSGYQVERCLHGLGEYECIRKHLRAI